MYRSVLAFLVLWVNVHCSLGETFYKIYLTQNASSQFAEYEVSVPALDEFTFCLWLRTTDFSRDQAIFTYVVNHRALISLWLERGGANLHSHLGRADTITPVDWRGGQWRQLCMSWQSDSGAWALYQDGRLLICEASDKIVGNFFPGGGKILLGAPDKRDGVQGWEGEFYDFVMILSSTIDKNDTYRKSLQSLPKMPKRNTLEDSYMKYIIERLEENITNEVSSVDNHVTPAKHKSYLVFRTPFSHVEHEVGTNLELPKSAIKKVTSNSKGIILPNLNEPEFLDMRSFNRDQNIPSKTMSTLWSLINKAGQMGKFKTRKMTLGEQFRTATENSPILSEFETPPPPGESIQFDAHMDELTEIRPPTEGPPGNFHSSHMDEIRSRPKPQIPFPQNINQGSTTVDPLPTLSEMETPPSPAMNDNKVYGYWSGGTFADSVLGFLKNENFNFRSVPKTIPLKKVSEIFPYASEKKIVATVPLGKGFSIKHSIPSSFSIIKRYVRSPEINVKIINHSLRNIIAEQHAKDEAVNVEVHPRGETSNSFEEDIQYTQDVWNPQSVSKHGFPRSFSITNHRMVEESDGFPQNSLFDPNYSNEEHVFSDNEDKWNKIKTFNNEFINTKKQSRLKPNLIEDNVFSDNLHLQSLPRLSFQQSPFDVKARELNKNKAIDYEMWKVANRENVLQTPLKVIESTFGNKTKYSDFINKLHSNKRDNTFYKAVRLGNALNEGLIIGKGDDDKKKSFVGGDDTVPDINRHRSEIDNRGQDQNGAPPSLQARVCERASPENRIYDQSEGRIILSKNYMSINNKLGGLKLLSDHYKYKCDKINYLSQHQNLLLIRWKETPVRLYGGGKLMRALDLCDQF